MIMQCFFPRNTVKLSFQDHFLSRNQPTCTAVPGNMNNELAESLPRVTADHPAFLLAPSAYNSTD